jgi:hypothetical protein
MAYRDVFVVPWFMKNWVYFFLLQHDCYLISRLPSLTIVHLLFDTSRHEYLCEFCQWKKLEEGTSGG